MMLVQQAILLGISATILVAVRHYGSRGELTFALTAMWAAISALGILATLLLPSVGVVGDSLGVIPAALLAGTASFILGAIALLLSLRVSRLEGQQRDLAESIGLSTVAADALHPSSPDATLVIVPAFNEAVSVGSVVHDLREAGLPVLVVDDGSTDATQSVARSSGAVVLALPVNLGVGGALRAGIAVARRAGFSQVVQCDADGQHPTAAVLALIEAQRVLAADLLIGSRFVDPSARREEGFVRFAATLILSRIASRAAGGSITDASSGLRAIRTPLLDELARSMPAHYLGDTFEINVMAGRSGYVIQEIPVKMRPRAHGSSTASRLDAVRLTVRAILVALLRFQRVKRRPPDGMRRS